MTLTFELDLGSVKMNQQARSEVISFISYYADTHTYAHTGPTALSGPLKRARLKLTTKNEQFHNHIITILLKQTTM